MPGAPCWGVEHPWVLLRVTVTTGAVLMDHRTHVGPFPLPLLHLQAFLQRVDGVSLPFQFSCCGVLGPEDFGNGSRFQELHPGTPWPQACCARDGLLQAGELLGWEQCQERSPGYIHEQVGLHEHLEPGAPLCCGSAQRRLPKCPAAPSRCPQLVPTSLALGLSLSSLQPCEARGMPPLSPFLPRAASPPSARPCRSTSLSLGCAAWPCWALRY